MNSKNQIHHRAAVSARGAIAALLAPAAMLPFHASAQSLLFGDTFDRANGLINAAADGITNNTGTDLSAGAYSFPYIDANPLSPDGNATNGGGADIQSNQMRLSVGNGTSNAFINHNFINGGILTDGGFEVSLEVTGYNQTFAGQGGGFAVGMTEAEALATGDALNGNNNPPDLTKMTEAFGTTGDATADFWIAVRGNGTLAWGLRGADPTVNTADVGSKTGKISVRFFGFADFNASTTVYYEIFFDDVSQATGTFPWGGTDANYIGIDSRDNQGVSFDNLSISTFVLSPVATLTATPASISNVDTSVPVTLDWTTLFAPGGATYEILDGSSSTIDSGAAAATGSLPLTLDGTAGDQSYTFNLLSGASVVASDTVTVTTLAPAYSKTQSAVRFDETSTAESVVLSLSGLANFPAGATYEISDDNNSAVTYFSTTTGTITDPLELDIDVNPSLGSVTFTVLLKDSGGNVFDTLTYTVDSSPAAPLTVTNLFSDSYDRGTLMPDPLDIDSDVTGMSGSAFTPTVGAVYLETYQANPTTPDDASIQVSAIDTLQSATGTGMSGWAIDHNFIDTAISTDGALSVAMDLEAIDSGSGDFGDRYAGFGIGLSLDEINAFTDESGAAGTGPRGAVNAGGGRGVADFYCSVSLDDEVQVFANGVLVGSFPVDGDGVFGDGTFATTPVRLRTDFAFGDPVNFAANSFVFYQTYCDNLLVTSGYFRLTQGAANYIGFSSRATNFVDTDDLAITTVSSVDMPYPGDPMVTEAGLAIDNLIYDAGDVVGADLSISNGGAGVIHAVQLSQDLATFLGVPGNAIGSLSPSGVIMGVTDGSGDLVLPAVDLPAGFETKGFARGEALHWPAP